MVEQVLLCSTVSRPLAMASSQSRTPRTPSGARSSCQSILASQSSFLQFFVILAEECHTGSEREEECINKDVIDHSAHQCSPSISCL